MTDIPNKTQKKFTYGAYCLPKQGFWRMWCSRLAHLSVDQVVTGSNPVIRL